jgi:hypothetical protein
MQSSSGSWSTTLHPVVDGFTTGIGSDEILRQTPSGALAAAGATADLPVRLRMLLYLINGRRRMAEYRDMLPRYRNLDDAFEVLARKGFIQRERGLSPH